VFGSPQLIILDEPNANLDQAGEMALTEALFNIKKRGAALVIVGHRPSTLDQADKILVLKDGLVAMFGPREEVLNALRGGTPAPVKSEGNSETRNAMPLAVRAPQEETRRPAPDSLSVYKNPIAVRPTEAARLAGICRSSVFQAIRSGQLPARKYGRRTLILTEDLWSWLADLPVRSPRVTSH
jgi:excisionase family DNA binding protein